jgi:hypothetical protein
MVPQTAGASAASEKPGYSEVNRQPVKSVDDLKTALKKTSDKPTLILISRQGNNLFLTVKPSNG